MLRQLLRKLNAIRHRFENNTQEVKMKNHDYEVLPKSIDEIETILEKAFKNCSDFIMKKITLKNGLVGIVACIDGLVNNETVNDVILKPLMIELRKVTSNQDLNVIRFEDILEQEYLPSGTVQKTMIYHEAIDAILNGEAVIFLDDASYAYKVDTKGLASRGIQEPLTEAVVRGPREGFNESLRTNTSLLRQKIKDVNLKFESMTLGSKTKTEVAIGYIEGLAREDIVKLVRHRLQRIKVDAILESGYLEEFIEDNPFSIFPQIGNSERPDKVAAKILEGRVAILCDGTPFVLTVPFLLIEAFQASEDYYSKPYFVSIIRMIRLLAFFIAVGLPGLYVAFIGFHPQTIPFKLLVSMASSSEGIPFPPVVEALVMLTAFELLREAGVRMPRPVGQAVSIVGALVLGEAAVQAGIASNLMIIVTATTAISTFIVPSLGGTMPILRIFLLISGVVLGFMGLFLATIIILTHLYRLKSFGVLYMEPFLSLDIRKYKDTFIRMPLWMMFTRPEALAWRDSDDSKYKMKVKYRRKED